MIEPIDLVATLLLVVGTGFMLLSAVGVLRMPDVYMRLQVASKASSLGAGCLMLGVALHFEDFDIVVRAVLVVIFIFLTTPVSAHLIGRAAYITGVRLWEASVVDELRDAYDPRHGTLVAHHPADLVRPAEAAARPGPGSSPTTDAGPDAGPPDPDPAPPDPGR
jgi:multicomponent Na+:H+ antiporter subunit G